ncbi:hybrid sensor histidine kinase/response regulator transcription factor, partial [Saccharicrinis fermentans]|uniref:hybrid sensor histidine kinase/response regulator transcription factor n=1 Tax=Saccharicrinis fermentans TaxID=982 RepID=UPI0005C684EF
INNAFKYTKVNSSISINYKRIGKDLFVSFTDTGKGIDSEDLPHIFERFYQSKKKHSAYTGGSGIGLAFTKRLVEMHYGDIWVTSTLGQGSTFELRLPVVVEESCLSNEEHEEILKVEKEQEQKSLELQNIDVHHIKSNVDFSGASVYFVEDSTEMRNFVCGVLQAFFKVKSFVNGQECLDAMKEEWPDIVISDVLMPEMNGFDLCKNIKADIKTSHIPVILLTACTTIDDQIQGLQLGADAYIRKPFDVQHLITRTETLLKGRQQLRERYSIDLPLTQRKEDSSAKDNAFLEKLYQLMEQNLDNQELDLDLFAKELYLNRTHFFQKVKAITNQTPYELLKNYRIKKAAEFLGQEKVSVNEAFAMTGFKSRAHFNKLFKEKYQVTPGKYATEMKNKYTGNSSE